ncbi:YkgJ family cysteine cluster protein [Candidatus Sumerlaeota bacterium]|nr:YkgJ family cysteine cluster protein [Candidatus Sumerlaeota bacterium]
MRQDRRWEHFECQQCGKCCIEIGLPYDPKSIFEIAKFLGLGVNQVIEQYYGHITEDGKDWESEDHKRTPCPFLNVDDDRKSCTIYSVRPEGCKLYPFNTDGGRQNVDCPGARIVYAKLKEEEN